MPPEELCEAVDAIVGAVSGEPVLVEAPAGQVYELDSVEASITGRLYLFTKGQGL